MSRYVLGIFRLPSNESLIVLMLMITLMVLRNIVNHIRRRNVNFLPNETGAGNASANLSRSISCQYAGRSFKPRSTYLAHWQSIS